ncbi:hypothetical protein CPB84DRAFT_1666854, partial [Gymnopilus junonius]
SDMHSFGMTALELLTQKPPFCHRRRPYSVLTDLVAGLRPARPERIEMTDGLLELIMACWSRNP